MIEEPYRHKTKNQIGTPPEPDVLMKDVKASDRNDKQNAFHAEWTLTLTKRFALCQELVMRIGLSGDAAHFFGIDVVTLDHAVEGLAVHGQNAGRRLLVATGVLEDLRDVAAFDFG